MRQASGILDALASWQAPGGKYRPPDDLEVVRLARPASLTDGEGSPYISAVEFHSTLATKGCASERNASSTRPICASTNEAAA